MKRAITVEAFAEAYAIPAKTVRKKIRQGEIRAMNIGTPHHPIYRIPVAELDRFERASATENVSARNGRARRVLARPA